MQIYKEVCENLVQNVINNVKNGMIIAYGQSKSGKSTNFYGNPKT